MPHAVREPNSDLIGVGARNAQTLDAMASPGTMLGSAARGSTDAAGSVRRAIERVGFLRCRVVATVDGKLAKLVRLVRQSLGLSDQTVGWGLPRGYDVVRLAAALLLLVAAGLKRINLPRSRCWGLACWSPGGS